MKIIKLVVNLFATLGLLGVVAFGDIISASVLLAFSSMSLGILLGENEWRKKNEIW